MINAVLFDLDGTLIDTNALIIESFKYTLKSCLDLEVDAEDIVGFFGEPLTVTLSRFHKERLDELMSTYRYFNDRNHDKLAAGIADAADTLRLLKDKGIKIAVVTSKRRTVAERGIDLFNLRQYIDEIITPEDTSKHKPDGEPAALACKRLGVLPENALMVGDSHFDILCGKNAGCKTCVVEYTALSIDSILKYGPDHKVKNLSEILKLIAENNLT